MRWRIGRFGSLAHFPLSAFLDFSPVCRPAPTQIYGLYKPAPHLNLQAKQACTYQIYRLCSPAPSQVYGLRRPASTQIYRLQICTHPNLQTLQACIQPNLWAVQACNLSKFAGRLMQIGEKSRNALSEKCAKWKMRQ